MLPVASDSGLDPGLDPGQGLDPGLDPGHGLDPGVGLNPGRDLDLDLDPGLDPVGGTQLLLHLRLRGLATVRGLRAGSGGQGLVSPV